MANVAGNLRQRRAREQRDHPVLDPERDGRARALRKPICGSVHVEGGGISVTLPVGACPSAGGGGGRPPNAAETDVIDRWRRLHLDQPRVAPGELEAFVKQVLRL